MTRQPTVYLAAPDRGLYNTATIVTIWTETDGNDPARWGTIHVTGNDYQLGFDSADTGTAGSIEALAGALVAQIGAAEGGAVIEWTGTGWRTRAAFDAEGEGRHRA